MKRKLSRERYIGVTNNEKLSKSLLTFVNTLEFIMVFWEETLSKRNRKSGYVTITLLFEKLKL